MSKLHKMLLLISGMVVMSLFLFFCSTWKVNASNKDSQQIRIMSVQIAQGESLWSIASDYYCDHYEDVQDYVDAIKRTNGITSDTIHAGNYLVIPYYE